MEERLTNEQLRESSPFLKSSAVRSGDVLLTRGRGGESSFIAAMTGGTFSHAALWLPLGDTPVPTLIEAEDLGVGFTTLTPIYFRAKSTLISTYSIPNSPQAWKLMRHPAIEGIDPETLVAASEAFLKKVLHRRYSALERLVKPVGLPAPLDSVAGRLIGFADRLSRAQGHHGFFCSELVALYFEELRLNLFQPGGRPATHVSPNDLDSSDCLLRCVEDAFLAPDSLGSDFEATRSEFEWPTRENALPVFVKSQHDGDVLMRTLERFQQLTRDKFVAQMNESERVSRSMYEQMRKQAAEAAGRGHGRYADKFSSQANLALLMLHLEREIAAHQERMHSRPHEEPISEAPGQALLIVTRKQIELSSANQTRNLRTTLLYALETVRIRLGDPDVSHWMRYKLARKRREFIEEWRTHRNANKQALQFANEILETKPPSAKTLEYVNEIIGKAQIAALAQSGVSDATAEEAA